MPKEAYDPNAPIPIDPTTGRPVRGKGSRGARTARPKELGGARLPRSALGGGGDGSVRGAPKVRGTRGRGRGRGRGVSGGGMLHREGDAGMGTGGGPSNGGGIGGFAQTGVENEKGALFLPQLALLDIPEERAALDTKQVATDGATDKIADLLEDGAEPQQKDSQEQPPSDKEDGDEDDEEEEEKDIVLQPRTDEEKAEMRALIESFSEEQLHRFEVFRRSRLPKNAVKKVLTTILGSTTVPPSVIIALGGTGKLFIGDIVEIGLEVMQDWGEEEGTALSPAHIREAYRRWKAKNRWL
ncbi:hTAFII28-like protein conserved region-domain-containing protein [Chytriomyces sp. MP71]|nr:hTAFII28-like protein conserved region-domain-containing protein [Chytriomyces sp. MP71]